MSNMYGPRRIMFHNKGIKKGVIAICGTHKDSKGGNWHPMGRYMVDCFGRIELYMVDNPFKARDQHLSFIGCANTKLEARKMILKACQNNPEHIMNQDEYVDDKGKIQKREKVDA